MTLCFSRLRSARHPVKVYTLALFTAEDTKNVKKPNVQCGSDDFKIINNEE